MATPWPCFLASGDGIAASVPSRRQLQGRSCRPAALRLSAVGLLVASTAAVLALAKVAAFVALPLGALGVRPRRTQGLAAQQLTRRKGWGDDVVFQDATLQSNVEAGEGLRLISLEAAPDYVATFKQPGQFVQAKATPDAKPSFFAISSPPGAAGPLEFLIKEADSNAWLTGSQKGDIVLLSPAMGRGFNLSCEAWTSADVNQVGIFATGTGVAPIRAAIECGALKGKVCRLYVGARTHAALGFADRFDAWRRVGVDVVPVLSKGDGAWAGRRGYVQDALRQDEERGEGFVLPARHGALLCGQKEMVASVRSIYEGLGVPQERTLLNF